MKSTMDRFTNPNRPPAPGYVALTCSAHGAFVAWCWPPAPTSPVGCPAACELSDAQADGRSCVVCEGDAPSVPVGRSTATGSQVFACADCCGESS